jgi:hypothetical protein
LQKSARKPGHRLGTLPARLLNFAEEVGAEKVGRHNSISVRYRSLDRAERQWLTIFVITAAGTFYCGWLYRWHEQGFRKSIEKQYERDLKAMLKCPVVFAPGDFRDAVPLHKIHRRWTSFSGAVKNTLDKLRLCERPLPVKGLMADASAIEGLATEAKIIRYVRSRSLREDAMRRADGICAVCRHDFKKVLGGRGVCVLHVHHLKQLSVRDKPKWTRRRDLVVVCANCHSMLHFVDRGSRPLLPSDLRARLENS